MGGFVQRGTDCSPKAGGGVLSLAWSDKRHQKRQQTSIGFQPACSQRTKVRGDQTVSLILQGAGGLIVHTFDGRPPGSKQICFCCEQQQTGEEISFRWRLCYLSIMFVCVVRMHFIRVFLEALSLCSKHKHHVWVEVHISIDSVTYLRCYTFVFTSFRLPENRLIPANRWDRKFQNFPSDDSKL